MCECEVHVIDETCAHIILQSKCKLNELFDLGIYGPHQFYTRYVSNMYSRGAVAVPVTGKKTSFFNYNVKQQIDSYCELQ